MNTNFRSNRIACAASVAALTLGLSHAVVAADQAPLKIGVIISYTGPQALAGAEFDDATRVFLKEHGDTIAGRKVQFIKRDTGGPSPDVAKRLATELVVADKVDMIVGIDTTPTAIGVGVVSNQAKVPVFVINASTAGILKSTPYMARFGYVGTQIETPFGTWAAKSGIKSVYMLYADYAPGIDATAAFKTSFTANGGRVLGEIGFPTTTSDFSSDIQRIKEAKPDAAFIFISLGPSSQQFMKAWADAGMKNSGIKLIGEGGITDETNLDTLGDAGIGIVSPLTYSAALPSKVNADFVKAFIATNGPKLRPNILAVATYDMLTAMYRVIGAQGGQIDPDKTMALVRGMKLDSARGAFELDPVTREPIQNVYFRRVERQGGQLQNVVFDTIPMVRPSTERPAE